MNGKILTSTEYKELVEKDPVLQFMQRVNDGAINDPMWHENYTLALYQSFGRESQAHLLNLGVGGYMIESDPPNISPTPVETPEQLLARAIQPSQEEREKREAAYYLNVVWPEICGGSEP